MQLPTKQKSEYRPDIDGLRAVAVLLVVLFHTELGFRGGYVGVDVFFVISGFLITGILLRELERNSFSLTAFWVRRIRRIMPAMLAVLLPVVVAGFLLMTSVDYRDLGSSVQAQALLAANFYFWHSTGYFDGAAYEKPLLHTWSLAVEEQFYLLLPVVLLVLFKLGKGRVLIPLIIMTAGSFLVGLWATAIHPNAAYYLLPARAWELLLGAVLAAWKSPPKWIASSFASIIGTFLIVASGLYYTEQTAYPGMAALAPCLGAASVLLGNSSSTSWYCSWYKWSPLVFIGQISYSLYLWHWPIVSFLKYRTSGSISVWAGLLVVLVSIVLAFLSWKFVETPFRQGQLLKRRGVAFIFAGTSMGVAFACGTLIVLNDGFSFRFPAKVLAYAASKHDIAFYKSLKLKDAETGRYIPLGRITGDGKVELMIWGDSHAMFIVPPLRRLCEQYGVSGAAFTRSATPPVLNYISPTAPRYLARDSVAYNQNVLDFALRNQVKKVLLTAYWTRDFERGSSNKLCSGLLATVNTLQTNGTTVYFLRNVPVQTRDVPRDLARASMMGVDTETLGVSVQEHRRHAAVEDSLVEELQTRGVIILDATIYLSDSNGICRAEWDGKAAYWDTHHLSSSGAMRLLPLFENFVTNGSFSSSVARP